MAPARITRSARRRGVLAARGNMIAASFFSGTHFYQGICPLCCILSYASICHKCRGSPVSYSERERRVVMTQPSTRILIAGAGQDTVTLWSAVEEQLASKRRRG